MLDVVGQQVGERQERLQRAPLELAGSEQVQRELVRMQHRAVRVELERGHRRERQQSDVGVTSR